MRWIDSMPGPIDWLVMSSLTSLTWLVRATFAVSTVTQETRIQRQFFSPSYSNPTPAVHSPLTTLNYYESNTALDSTTVKIVPPRVDNMPSHDYRAVFFDPKEKARRQLLDNLEQLKETVQETRGDSSYTDYRNRGKHEGIVEPNETADNQELDDYVEHLLSKENQDIVGDQEMQETESTVGVKEGSHGNGEIEEEEDSLGTQIFQATRGKHTKYNSVDDFETKESQNLSDLYPMEESNSRSPSDSHSTDDSGSCVQCCSPPTKKAEKVKTEVKPVVYDEMLALLSTFVENMRSPGDESDLVVKFMSLAFADNPDSKMDIIMLKLVKRISKLFVGDLYQLQSEAEGTGNSDEESSEDETYDEESYVDYETAEEEEENGGRRKKSKRAKHKKSASSEYAVDANTEDEEYETMEEEIDTDNQENGALKTVDEESDNEDEEDEYATMEEDVDTETGESSFFKSKKNRATMPVGSKHVDDNKEEYNDEDEYKGYDQNVSDYFESEVKTKKQKTKHNNRPQKRRHRHKRKRGKTI